MSALELRVASLTSSDEVTVRYPGILASIWTVPTGSLSSSDGLATPLSFPSTKIVAPLGVVVISAMPSWTTGIKMTGAAARFLDSLTPEQKAKATFKFDDTERFNWNFVPLQDQDKKPLRKGLRLEEMTPEQRSLALALAQRQGAGWALPWRRCCRPRRAL